MLTCKPTWLSLTWGAATGVDGRVAAGWDETQQRHAPCQCAAFAYVPARDVERDRGISAASGSTNHRAPGEGPRAAIWLLLLPGERPKT